MEINVNNVTFNVDGSITLNISANTGIVNQKKISADLIDDKYYHARLSVARTGHKA